MTSEARAQRFRLRTGERRVLLVVGDFLVSCLAVFVAVWMWGELDYLGPTVQFIQTRSPWFIFLPLPWLLLLINTYDIRRAASFRETVRGVLLAALVGFIIYLFVYFRAEGTLPRRGVLYFIVLASIFTLAWRGVYVRVLTAPGFLRRVLIVGGGESGRALLKEVRGLRPLPFILVGFVDDDPAKCGKEIEGHKVLGDNAALLRVIQEEAISDIIVAISGLMNGKMFQALLDAQQLGVEITRMPVAYEELLGRVPIRYLESDWLLRSFVDQLRVSSVYLLAKRLLDGIGALVGLAILGILLPVISPLILLESGRPLFHIQRRLGQGGRPFKVLKFRTMRQDAEADGQAHWARLEDPRTTPVGRLLRRTHLDEFPQFWNVLLGDMSLVGPRPERPELVAELERQIPFYRARLLVKPGIGGWAQVNYGKGASIEGSAEKLEFDLYYIQHRSLSMDIQIILRSIGSAVGLRGV